MSEKNPDMMGYSEREAFYTLEGIVPPQFKQVAIGSYDFGVGLRQILIGCLVIASIYVCSMLFGWIGEKVDATHERVVACESAQFAPAGTSESYLVLNAVCGGKKYSEKFQAGSLVIKLYSEISSVPVSARVRGSTFDFVLTEKKPAK